MIGLIGRGARRGPTEGHRVTAMVRSVIRTCILGAGLCMVLAPSAAFAANDSILSNAPSGYSAATLQDTCTGYGLNGAVAIDITLKAKITSDGTTPATQLRIASRLQRRASGAWVVAKRYPLKELSFAADGTSHSLLLKRSYGFLVPPGGGTHRFVFRLRALHGATVTFSDKIIGTAYRQANCRSN